MSIESLIPKINIPTMGSMLGRTVNQPSPEDALLDQVAEQQLEEEKGVADAVFTMLDWLGRPQAAVAGVLTDLVDGGDFSPWDRVSHAIMGEERHRMKGFLDEIAPGEWSNVRLPDWMGGSDFDILKEGAGFVGDIFTDPLMAVNMFTSLGKVGARAGVKMAKFHGGRFKGTGAKVFSGKEGADILEAAAHNPKMADEVNDVYRQAMESIGVSHQTSQAMVVQNMRLRELHILWENILKNPDDYMRAFKSEEAKDTFLKNIAPYLHTAEDPRTLMAPGFASRLQRGEASLIAARVPWLMRTVGIPDGQFSLIPKIADEWVGSLMQGLDEMTRHVRFNTAMGRGMTGWTNKMLKWGTGSKEGDAVLAAASVGHHNLDDELQRISETTAKIFRTMSKDDKQIVIDMVERPYEFSYSSPGWLATREMPEHLQEPIQEMRKIFGERHAQLQAIPGLKRGFIGVGPEGVSNKKAYDLFTGMAKSQGTKVDMPSWKDIRKIATKETKEKYNREKWDIGKDRGDLFKRDVTKKEEELLRAHFEIKQARLKNLIPNPALAYVPHFMTETAKGIIGRDSFATLLNAGKFIYKGEDAALVWERSGLKRTLNDYGIKSYNEMVRDSNLPYDFLNQIYTNANKNLKGKDRKLLDKVFGGTSPEQVSLFIDDPTDLIVKYMTDTNHAIKLQDKKNLMIKMFTREVSEEKWAGGIGERLVLLSEQGMRARYGEAWKEAIGEEGFAMWKAMTKKKALDNPGQLNRMFYDISQSELGGAIESAKAAGFQVPVHAMQGDLLEGMERFVRLSQEPQYKSWMMKQFVGITNAWKATTLAFFPAYHSRNFVNGFWQAANADSLHIPSYIDATRTMASMKGAAWKPGQKVMLGNSDSLTKQITERGWHGKPITREEGYHLAMNEQILQKGFYSPDALQMSGTEVQLLTKQITKAYNMSIKKATDWLFKRGNEAENVHRLAHFFNRLSKGDDPFQAAQSVKKYFYNMNEMSSFDRAIMPVFPFWNWTRKNVPATAQQLMQNPGAFSEVGRIVKAGQDAEAEGIDPALLPKWINKNLGVPTKFDKETGQMSVRLWNQWMGWTDLRDWVGGEPQKIAENLLNPAIKVPIELALNKSFYTEEAIERFPGEPYGPPFLGMDMSKKGVHLFKNIRMANELNKLIQGQTEAGDKPLLNRIMSAAGVVPKEYFFDIEKLEKGRKFETAKRERELKRSLNYMKKKFPDRAIRVVEKYKKQVKKV